MLSVTFSLNFHSHESIITPRKITSFFHWPNNTEVEEVLFCMSKSFWLIPIPFSALFTQGGRTAPRLGCFQNWCHLENPQMAAILKFCLQTVT